MTKKDIEVGKTYIAKVSGVLCKVRVTQIRCVQTPVSGGRRYPRELTRYECVNLGTGRRITVRSAQRFRKEA